MTDDAPTEPPEPAPPPTAPPPTAPPGFGFWAALGWYVVFCVVDRFFGILAAPLWLGGEVGGILAGDLGGLAAAAAIVHWRLYGREREALALRGAHPGHAVLALLLVPVAVVLADGLSSAAEAGYRAVGVPEAYLGTREGIAYLYAVTERLGPEGWAFFVLGVWGASPALSEELFYRGFLGRGLVARKGAVAGVLLTSLLFGLSHAAPIDCVVTGALGAVMHVIYLNSRSLVAPMLFHAAYNAFITAAASAAGRVGPAYFASEGPPSALLFCAAAGSFAALLGLLVAMRTRWVLPDGSAWDPGYATAESPPAALGAVARVGRPPLWAVGVTAAACAAFAAALWAS